MRLTSIEIRDYPPLKHFAVDNLSDTVVIGGPNGVGKTKMQEAVLQKFRKPTTHPNVRLVLEATSPEEVVKWNGKKTLDTAVAGDASVLYAALQRKQKRGQVRRGVLNFDSSRTFEKVKPYPYSWDFPDPMEEAINWDFTFSPLSSRFTDMVHSLHRKLRSQKEKIARRALEMDAEGAPHMPLGLEDHRIDWAAGRGLPINTQGQEAPTPARARAAPGNAGPRAPAGTRSPPPRRTGNGTQRPGAPLLRGLAQGGRRPLRRRGGFTPSERGGYRESPSPGGCPGGGGLDGSTKRSQNR